jgi:hypothetical protein
MAEFNAAALDDPTGESRLLSQLSRWEVALQSVSRLAVVFALSLALILILGHQLGPPV